MAKRSVYPALAPGTLTLMRVRQLNNAAADFDAEGDKELGAANGRSSSLL